MSANELAMSAADKQLSRLMRADAIQWRERTEKLYRATVGDDVPVMTAEDVRPRVGDSLSPFDDDFTLGI